MSERGPDWQPSLLPEPKRLWLEALRSEEFEQGRGALTTLNPGGGAEHCCLGVLCQVAVKAGVALTMTTSDNTSFGVQKVAYDGCVDLPPDSVMRWAFGEEWALVKLDVVVDDEDFDERDRVVPLAELNDNHGWPFEQIAHAIEESL